MNRQMSSPNPRRGHHIINNGVKDIYRDIIKRFVDTFGTTYLDSNNYLNLVQLNIINEVRRGGLPADCVLRTAPLPHETKREIVENTVYTPEREIYTNYRNAERFGRAKQILLLKVTILMRDICLSLREENKMPDDLDDKMGGLRQFITDDFNSDVFVDEQAKAWWERERGPGDADRLQNWIQQVNEMLMKTAGKGTIQLVIHWGQWAFRVSDTIICNEPENIKFISSFPSIPQMETLKVQL